MLTEFGKFVRKLRIDKGVVLGEMAKSIEVSSAYLSAVENGNKNITEQLIKKIVFYFSLNEVIENELRSAAKNSAPSIKLDLRGVAEDERVLVSAFARQVSDLSADQKRSIFDILNLRTNKKETNSL